ncbi:MAG: hypothetical protein UT24_C0001G0019 [Candidatus Woesebacteria bacterium GW2011_GWB1_39_12]|uniref:Uncharacterized protein n=2 Tax=Candidatus Woeseibacteriota TaxID=1752722 RepID=A0A0G0M3H7_9BACT|nr:MAG: hypothetical protein UT23_C0001G0019 [Candidatus Woesebacteria bacterium GW2011_GWA1_39_12]KKR01859.1 MAG: hypothetical protein UT24_C0001G0019 [Candidatus Woesebacteria bacterium GW2011_GWB1_39_12]
MTALKRGFTLIELLIVMAILGVLAVVVLVAINPAEQLRRARDSGRISGTQQIGRAISAYFTANGCIPGVVGAATCPATTAWDDDLTLSEELQTIPALIDPAGACTPGSDVNGWCYGNDGTENFVVYAELESEQRIRSCGAAATTAFSVFSSVDARGGVSATEPTAGTAVTFCGP